jgi:hypothetical protein
MNEAYKIIRYWKLKGASDRNILAAWTDQLLPSHKLFLNLK